MAGTSPAPPAANQIDCSIPESQIFSGGVDRGQIPDLTDPDLVLIGHPDAAYVLDTDRVMGVRLGGEWVAVPHNILWWHEVVNFNRGSERAVVTYCPLTGSGIAFERDGVERFQVSGLLFNNNLMMFDPETESLWPQMSRGARCGPRDGDDLGTLPSLETTWAAWRRLHPDTRVVSGATGFSRDYTRYPYGNYEEPGEPPLFPIADPDPRRDPKERVFGVPAERGPGLAFPFLELASVGGPVVVHDGVGAVDIVLLWDDVAQAAAVYRRDLAGQSLTLEVAGGVIRDLETGSEWNVEGLAVAGPLIGSRLERVTDAYVAFWFAWSTFDPGTRIWLAP